MHRKLWLEKLIKDNNFKLGAEIGVQAGNTLKHLVETCPDLTMIGVDIWADKAVRVNNTTSEELKNWPAKQFYYDLLAFKKRYNNRIVLHRDFSEHAAIYVEDGSLDFVFIDAAHTTEGVSNDITAWAPKVKVGGFVIGHDINMISVAMAVNMHYTNYEQADDNIWYLQKS
jgi:hypothetical protein